MRALPIAAALALCLPLLVAGFLVGGGTSSPLPLGLGLLTTALAAACAAFGRLRLFAAGAVLALLLVTGSAVFDSTRIETEAELGAARFGLPFAFVEAKLSATPPLPYALTWNPYEDPARLLATRFLLACAVGLGLAWGAALALRLATQRRSLGAELL